MKTLKTISVILPMTLLLACGGGGGGYSALPAGSSPQEIEPTAIPTTLTLRADSMSFVPDDVDTDDADTESYTISTEATSIEVAPRSQPKVTLRYNDGPYEFKRYGKWFHVGKTNEGRELFWFGKWQGKHPRLQGWHHAGEDIETHVYGNNEFAGAVYTGKSIVKRRQSHGGGIREGDARVTINNDFTVDFLFSNIEGIDDLRYEGNFVDDVGVTIYGEVRDTVETPDLRINKRGKVKNGVQAKFYGSKGDAVGGFFRDIEEGVKRGAFGATRDAVEIK